jgi:short-subunit dehydrogenase
MTMRLDGKKALITGASSGIGRALAKSMAKSGVQLAISARRKDALESLADEIEVAGGKRPVVLTADLSVRGEAHKLGERALEALGHVDLLINNAGVGLGGATAVVGDDDEARTLFETNYWSALALVKALMPSIRGAQGAIVNVASMAAVAPFPLTGHYASSKAAMQMMSETLRMELRGTGVQILAVMPGPVETGMLAEFNEVPGGAKVLSRMPKGNVETLARKIVRALERNKRTVVYPSSLGIVRHFPTVSLRMSSVVMNAIDTADQRKMLGGSQGDGLARDARARFETAR